MAYLLENDKIEKFECQLHLEGAELYKSFARLIVECGGFNLLFNGDINVDGVCEVEIPKLKKLFPEKEHGKIRLEVIAEDTYFSPWEDDFVITPPKRSLKVENVSKGEIKKPKVSVSVGKQNIKESVKPKKREIKPDIDEIVSLLKENKITKQSLIKNKKLISIVDNTIRSYYSTFDETPTKSVLKEIINRL